jgi:hypothetical protein
MMSRICLSSYQYRRAHFLIYPYVSHLILARCVLHSLQSEEGLRRFQAGDLAESDQEWYRLVPDEAREALGKQEVQRQSVIFEVIKAERDYVSDLETVEEVR